uniref:p1 protein n=1 Tax=Beet western yellows virus TaxID=12042 RepID=A0A077JCC3_9VIRU|nr:P1 protein [Beet western yellows virus]
MTTSMLTFFLLASLCSLASSYAGTSIMSPGIANATDWPGYIEPAVPHCTPQVQLTYDCPPSKTLQDYSSHDILQEVWERGLSNTRTFWQEAKENLTNFYQSGVQVLSATSHKYIKLTLRGISYVWSSFIWATLCALWYLVREYTIETLILGWLYVFTVYMVKAVAWIFGASPIFLFNIGLSTLRGISRILWFRRPYNCEKSVEGFLSFKIPQSPPKHSVLQVQHPDGSHAGYATCVMLYNGTTGLLTARHVVSSGCKVTSTRNGNKIPLSEFKVETESSTRDLLLMAGPPNWEGTLACKAVHFQTAPYLCKCKATFFAFNEGAWVSSNAEITGASPCRNFISVLSVTDLGHSGTPYFNGKTLLGVHVGGAKEENANYMAPIPPRAGLTTPNYVFETTAPQGRIFTEEEILGLAEDFSYSEIHSIMAAQKGKAHYDMETAGSSGNGKAAASAETTAFRKESTHTAGESSGVKVHQAAVPITPKEHSAQDVKQATYMPPMMREGQAVGAKSPATTASSDAISEIKEAILRKIDVRSIEKQVVETLAEKAMKKPRRAGRRRSANRQKTSVNTSAPSTGGNQGPEKKPPVLNKPEASPSFTTLNKRANRVGELKSSSSTQSWRPTRGASGGPNSGPKRN